MSGTISEYLKANNNKLTELLKSQDLACVFLDNTLIRVFKRNGEWWCDIKLGYTLSCNDFKAIATALASYWWCISPNYGDANYRLSINLKKYLK